jgi:predicted DCC family thiol-disulfide oxidoreductase YuxK
VTPVVPGSTDPSGPVLLYDGACGFCSAVVQLVLKRDRRGTLRFAALQGPFARALTARHPELAGVDSLVWAEQGAQGERVYVRSEAGLRLARYLAGPWHLALPMWLLPRFLRDSVYDVVARHRHRLAGPADTCFVPPPEARARFLDPESPPAP